MPIQREIEVFNIGRTTADKAEIKRWLDSIGAVEFVLPEAATDSDSIVGLAAKRCYMSFEVGLNPNVTKVRKDWFEYIENILKSGHGSVLEHATYNFAIEGLTRVATAELNRHRAGVAISEGSMRYIRFDTIPYWVPSMLRPCATDTPELAGKKMRSIEVFERAFGQDEVNYAELMEIWEIEQMTDFTFKKILTSMFRRVVGMGVSTGGVWTFNFRAVRHIMALRCTPHAEEEIALIGSMIAKQMCESEKAVFCDFVQDESGFWTPKYNKV
jgi:thymidylate synthase (FAD)